MEREQPIFLWVTNSADGLGDKVHGQWKPISRVATLTIRLRILFYYYFHFFALTLSHIDTAANQAVSWGFFCYHLEKSMMSFSHLPAAHIGASRPDPTRPNPARLRALTDQLAALKRDPRRLLGGFFSWKEAQGQQKACVCPSEWISRRAFYWRQVQSCSRQHLAVPSIFSLLKEPTQEHWDQAQRVFILFFFMRISWNGMIGITSSTGRDGRGSRPYSSNTAAFLWQRSDWSCFVKFLLYKRSLLRMDLESCIKWHLQVLPRGMTLIRIIHDPLQNNRLERNTTFSRRYFPGSALPFSHSLWRQIKNSLGSHWCQCLHSCLHRKAPWKIIKPTSSWAPWILKRLNTDFQSHFPRSDRGRERRLFVCVLLYRGCL